jgi:hypothetical protein
MLLDIYVDQSSEDEDVVRVLNNIVAIRCKPMAIKTDNGSEFISKVMIIGVIKEALSLSSADQASRQTMRWWKATMEDCAKNV